MASQTRDWRHVIPKFKEGSRVWFYEYTGTIQSGVIDYTDCEFSTSGKHYFFYTLILDGAEHLTRRLMESRLFNSKEEVKKP